MLDELLCEITKKDFVLKVKHDEAELLTFSSIVLPESYCSKSPFKHDGICKSKRDALSELEIRSQSKTYTLKL